MAVLDRLKITCVVVLWLGTVAPATAQAPNDALLRLLQVLRDRGSISAQEYDEIRLVAAGPARRGCSGQARQSSRACAASGGGRRPAAAHQQGAGEQVVREDRLARLHPVPLRRRAVAGQGPALEVPADRSVNANESFMIRRGRFVFSGDVTDHLSLYAQTDFNGSTGAAGLLAADAGPLRRRRGWTRPRLWRVRHRPVEGAVWLGEPAVQPEPRPRSNGPTR